MMTFFCKLLPPRPTFTLDISEAELKLMQEHAVYWRGLMAKGLVVAFGMVADAAGAYGVGIVEVESEADVQRLTANDPTIRSGQGFRFAIHPMPRGAVHPPFAAS
jgi:uncharacterized protein YciI